MNHEFPDFDYDIAPLIAQLPGWVDNSWHNDTMPCAIFNAGGDGLWLWFDYADPEFSEHMIERTTGDMKQFSLCDPEGVVWFQTDVWSQMLEYIQTNRIQIEQCAKECA